MTTRATAVQHACDRCDFRTQHASSLYTHTKFTHGNSIYRCKLCIFTTKYKYYLIRHEKKHVLESNAVVYNCEQCRYVTNYKRDLRLHATVEHGNQEYKYSCDMCNYNAKSQSYLQFHKYRMHNPYAKELKCEHCEYKTTKTANLKQHLRVVHGNQENTYKCDLCHYITKCKPYLDNHKLRKHNPNAKIFQCEYCPYKTTIKQALQKHINRKYSCNPSEKNYEQGDPVLHCKICSYQNEDNKHIALHNSDFHGIPKVVVNRLKIIKSCLTNTTEVDEIKSKTLNTGISSDNCSGKPSKVASIHKTFHQSTRDKVHSCGLVSKRMKKKYYRLLQKNATIRIMRCKSGGNQPVTINAVIPKHFIDMEPWIAYHCQECGFSTDSSTMLAEHRNESH